MFWLTDPKTKEKSVTLTAFSWGFLICTLKLLVSGITIMDKVTMSQFSGSDFGIAVGALGAIYVMRRNKDTEKSE